MIVYHGSNSNFSKLRICSKFSKVDESSLLEGYGIYFSLNRSVAESYGKILYTLDINDRYFKSYTKLNSCIRLVDYILDMAEIATNIEIKKYVDVKLIGTNLYNCNLGFYNLSRELELVLVNNYEFYNRNNITNINKALTRIRVVSRSLLKAYAFNSNSRFTIGVIKDVKPEVVRIVRKELVK